MNINKPSYCSINHDNSYSQITWTNAKSSIVQNPLSHKTKKSCQKYKSNKSVMFNSGMISNELFWLLTKIWTVSCWIAERNSTQIYVSVSISSYHIKETCYRITRVCTNCTNFTTTCVRMTCKKFYYQSRNLKKCIKKRSSNNTSPMSTHESH